MPIGGKRYCFTHRGAKQAIELRAGTTQGILIHSFDNSTTVAAMKRIVAKL